MLIIQDNSGHDCEPPDYYSVTTKLMFDVMRINDSEKRKSKNPVLIEDRKLQKEIQEALTGTNISENTLTISSC